MRSGTDHWEILRQADFFKVQLLLGVNYKLNRQYICGPPVDTLNQPDYKPVGRLNFYAVIKGRPQNGHGIGSPSYKIFFFLENKCEEIRKYIYIYFFNKQNYLWGIGGFRKSAIDAFLRPFLNPTYKINAKYCSFYILQLVFLRRRRAGLTFYALINRQIYKSVH